MADTPYDRPITFTDADTHRCPFPAYDRLRVEAPVYVDAVTGHYILTRYADVRKAVIDHRALSSAVGLVGIRESAAADEVAAIYEAEGWPPRPQFQSMDPPDHKTKRSLVDKAFARWNVQKAEASIEAIADELIGRFIDAGRVEFVTGFAAPLTISIIAGQLGVERADRDAFDGYIAQIQHWSDLAMELINPLLEPARHVAITRELIAMQHFYAANVTRVIARPDETLLSQLVQTVLVDGEPDVPEILELMKMILIAGNETTRFAMAAGMKLLIEHPGIARELAANPDLVTDFVEETLRLQSPVQTLFRRTVEDMELHGVPIPKGKRVEVRFGAANRDPAMFECPEKLKLDRANKGAHLAFGTGIHVCIGMQLARAELNIGFRAILRRMRNFRAAEGNGSYEYNTVYLSLGLTRLDLAFDRAD